MAKKNTNLTTEVSQDSQIEQFNIFTARLPNNATFVPCRRDNYHSQTKLDDEFTVNEMRMRMQSKGDYTQPKLRPSSLAQDGRQLLVLDVDEHKGETNTFIEDMGLTNVKTLTVGTPKGNGKHLYFWAPTKDFHGSSKVQENNVELFFNRPEDSRLQAIPGGIREDGVYVVLEDLPIAEIPETLAGWARNYTVKDQRDLELRIPDDYLGRELNTELALDEAYRYTSEFIMKFVRNKKNAESEFERAGGRDEWFVKHVGTQIVKFGIDAEQAAVQLTRVFMDPSIFTDTDREELCGNYTVQEFVRLKANGAFNFIFSEGGLYSRLSPVADFKRDQKGNVVQTVADYEEAVNRVLKYNLNTILNNPNYCKTLCQVMHQCVSTGNIFVARIMQDTETRIDDDTTIDVHQELSRLKGNSLSWLEYDMNTFNKIYCVGNKKLSGQDVFSANINKSVVVSNRYSTDDHISKDGKFYASVRPTIKPLPKDEYTALEWERAISLLYEMAGFIAVEEDVEWVITRYAHLLQRPFSTVQNFHISMGTFGSGKTNWHKVMAGMYPPTHYETIGNNNQLDKFVNIKPYMLFDDLDLDDITKPNLAWIKVITTSDNVSREVKFQQRIDTELPVNLSACTNYIPNDIEMLCDRRTTLTIGSADFDDIERKARIRQIWIDLFEHDAKLYRVLATVLHDWDISNYEANYKTKAQNDLIFRQRADNTLIWLAVYMYANDNLHWEEGELINRNDLISLARMIETISQGYITNTSFTGSKFVSIAYNNLSPPKKKLAKDMFKRICKDANKNHVKSKLENEPTWSNVIPHKDDWLELAARIVYGKTPKNIVSLFGLEDYIPRDEDDHPFLHLEVLEDVEED